MRIDAKNRAYKLRETLVVNNKALLADFSNTLQGKDTSKVIDLMPLQGTDSWPFRVKVNVKSIDPIASKAYGEKFHDTTKMSSEDIENLIKREVFDFPLWFKHNDPDFFDNVNCYNPPFIVQIAGCNFHDGTKLGGCLYCFVDNESNDGRPGKGKVYAGIEQTLASYQDARKKADAVYMQKTGSHMDPRVFRVSGGEPTLALDWILNLWRKMDDPTVVGQIDSNLSTASVVQNFTESGIYEPHILEKLAEFPIKVLTAIKGTDDLNIQNNVNAVTNLEEQVASLKAFVGAGFDIYPQMYNPEPSTLRNYLVRMEDTISNFSLKIHVGPLKATYGPTSTRLEAIGRKDEPIVWGKNYEAAVEVLDKFLNERHGVGYKDVVRSDVNLKLI